MTKGKQLQENDHYSTYALRTPANVDIGKLTQNASPSSNKELGSSGTQSVASFEGH